MALSSTLVDWSAKALAAAMATWGITASAVPLTLTQQGRIFTSDGDPVDGSVSIVFTLYDAPAEGTVLWAETQTVTLDEGYFSTALGEDTVLDPDLFDGSVRYLGVQVGADDEMTPRQALRSVPYAYHALTAEQALYADVAASADALGSFAPGDLLPKGSSLGCNATTQKVSAIDPATGNVTCSTDQNTLYSAASGGGLSLSGTNAFSIAASGVTAARIAGNAVRRGHLQGLEIAIYQQSAGCGGGLSTSNSCLTLVCGIQPSVNLLLYRGCSGDCDGHPSPISCSGLSQIGWLINQSMGL